MGFGNGPVGVFIQCVAAAIEILWTGHFGASCMGTSWNRGKWGQHITKKAIRPLVLRFGTNNLVEGDVGEVRFAPALLV
jgi:hypothetical protein